MYLSNSVDCGEQLCGYNSSGTPYLQMTNASEKYGIRYDATGNGKVDDSDDYAVYNDLKFDDRTLTELVVKPVMRVGNASYMKNKVFKLKGQKYLMKDFKDAEDLVELVPVSQKSVVNATTTGDIISSSVTIPGTDIKIGLTDYRVDTNSAKFAIIEGGAITEYKIRDSTTSPALATSTDAELIDGYYIYPTTISATYIELSIGKKADKFGISDGDTDVLGYAKAVVDDDDGFTGGADDNEFRLEDGAITIAKDSKEVLGATNVYAKYTKDKEFDLVTKNSKTATSGSKLKATTDPWDDFLNIDIDSVTGVGNSITFVYDGQDIDNDDRVTDTNDVATTATASTWAEKWLSNLSNTVDIGEQLGCINSTYMGIIGNTTELNYTADNQKQSGYMQATNATEKCGIRYDATGNGKVDDSDDYAVYNDLKFDDRTLTELVVKPVMRVGNASYMKNKVFKLKGQKYLMKDFKDAEDLVELVPVSQKSVVNATTTGDIISSSVTIPGTDIKIGLTDYRVDTNSAKFAIIEGGAITEYKIRDSTTSPALATSTDAELIDGYYIYPTTISATYIELSIGKKADKFGISDGDTDVLGYAKAVVDDDDGFTGGADDNEFRLEDGAITIAKDSKEVLGATNVYAKYTKDKEFDLVTKNSKTATSGSKLKATTDPWDDFLSIDIDSATVTGGTTEAVQLSTVKDTAVTSTDKSNFNLVLVGGPVANVLSAELVTAGKTTGDTGTVEVVSDAFSAGKYAIVVAGKTRVETASAASALAGML
ncbi:MAG: hypothetical protein ACE5J5_01030 [Candidatus Hydrothermarchaeales archaeon]